MYNSIDDARTALINSGVSEWFDFDEFPVAKMVDVVDHMYRNDATPEQAAVFFGVA